MWLDRVSMSDLERLRWLYGQFCRGNFSAAGEIFHPDVEWVMAGSVRGLGEPVVCRGREECAAAMRGYLSAWEWFRTEAIEFIEADDTILVVCRDHARPKGGSAELEREVAAVWTMRQGLATRVHYYDDRDEALMAAGLSS
jgi:ketosteroid isomerase-like protein